MPVHDWTRVEAGIFHDFHNTWIAELRNGLNSGLLPPDYYAMSEQHAGRYVVDLLTLQADPKTPDLPLPPVGGGTAVAEAPPKISRRFTASSAARQRRRSLTIRHVSGHRLVALLEIVSPANKDRLEHVDELVEKIESALRFGIHVLLADIFPPGRHDPQGIHGAVWERFDDSSFAPPDDTVTLASYVGVHPPDVYIEHLAFGSVLPEMPLFLHPERYLKVPLEETYEAAFRGTPAVWRAVLEGPTPPG